MAAMTESIATPASLFRTIEFSYCALPQSPCLVAAILFVFISLLMTTTTLLEDWDMTLL